MKGGRLHYFHRFGLIDGLLKMSNDVPDDRRITLTGLPAGGLAHRDQDSNFILQF